MILKKFLSKGKIRQVFSSRQVTETCINTFLPKWQSIYKQTNEHSWKRGEGQKRPESLENKIHKNVQ